MNTTRFLGICSLLSEGQRRNNKWWCRRQSGSTMPVSGRIVCPDVWPKKVTLRTTSDFCLWFLWTVRNGSQERIGKGSTLPAHTMKQKDQCRSFATCECRDSRHFLHPRSNHGYRRTLRWSGIARGGMSKHALSVKTRGGGSRKVSSALEERMWPSTRLRHLRCKES